MSDDESLKLENQFCFRLYSLTKLMNRQYSPVLKKLGLTYSQYLVMLVLWETNNTKASTSVKQLGEKLDLDSGTLSPLLKRLEKQNLVTRVRNKTDERSVEIKLTNVGCELKIKAKDIPAEMFSVTGMSLEALQLMNKQLDNLLMVMNKNDINHTRILCPTE
ncbi:MarR family winged helix-turn-helix transcriptional regulator [Colwellia sp. 20A7]|uniref:MarR family winged helix-turn-helix transcriptional regulator n=1 Tax=Colwellia sp. 20A7 TaxID=2689569 RepID=UPI001356E08A|nr:MarR family transcriptional regulator [Colwellia sp. 20A7]